MKNTYNRITPIYTFLSKLVFGNGLLQIQLKLIEHLPQKGNLLILGGGTGEILPYIFIKSPNLEISYLEASSKMIEKAKYNSPLKQKITFYHKSKMEGLSIPFDLVYAAFFFDLFPAKEIAEKLKKLQEICKPKHVLYVADFQLNRDVKYLMIRSIQIKASILFFRIMTKHKLKTLPPLFLQISKSSYKQKNTSTLRGNFLCAQVFERR